MDTDTNVTPSETPVSQQLVTAVLSALAGFGIGKLVEKGVSTTVKLIRNR